MASPIVRIAARGVVRDANSHPLCSCGVRMQLIESAYYDKFECPRCPIQLSKPAPGTEPHPLSTGTTFFPISDLRLTLSPGGDR